MKNTLNMNLERVADAFHKNVEELTEKDLEQAITLQKKALASANKVNTKSFGG